MKTCKACEQSKSLDEFYAHPNGAFGRLHICKECQKTRMKLRARTTPAVQEYNRKRSKLPQRRQARTEHTKEWRKQNPEGARAHGAVNYAIRTGRLKKEPCVICGEKSVHGHHKDYSKPLDVTWLCARCHHRLHAHFPELGGHYQEAP